LLPQTHTIIANLIHEDIVKDHNIRLNKNQLIFGSIKPDLYSGLPKLRHFKPQSFPVICQEISSLSAGLVQDNRAAVAAVSRNIGIVTHYVADYFCTPHNDRLTYKHHIIDHLKYENTLHQVFDETRLAPTRVLPAQWLDFANPEQVMNYLDDLHRHYETGDGGFMGDLIASLQATRAVASMIVRHGFGGGNTIWLAA
jgi:hypothetical protein